MPWRIPLWKAKEHSAFTALLAATILSSSLTVYLNNARVDDINHDRVVSCERTYEGVREIFTPFFAGSPPKRVALFNNRVNELKARCGQQTGVQPGRQP